MTKRFKSFKPYLMRQIITFKVSKLMRLKLEKLRQLLSKQKLPAVTIKFTPTTMRKSRAPLSISTEKSPTELNVAVAYAATYNQRCRPAKVTDGERTTTISGTTTTELASAQELSTTMVTSEKFLY